MSVIRRTHFFHTIMKGISIFLLLSIGALLAFSSKVDGIENVDPRVNSNQQIDQGFRELMIAAKAFKSASLTNNDEEFYTLKSRYKRIEWLLDYYQPEFIQDYINGPPLLKPERNSPSMVIVEPKGFQVLEEMLMEDDRDSANLQKQIDLLLLHLGELQLLMQRTQIQHRHVFEAAHLEIQRILSLGLTGFDSPSAKKVVEENQLALFGVFEGLEPYVLLKEKLFAKRFHKILLRADELFSNTSFNKFDRYGFLLEICNPFKDLLVDLQDELNVEFRELTTDISFAVNFHANSIFDSNYINDDYFLNGMTVNQRKQWAPLGEALFYDKRLSADESMSCASCHDLSKGFADGLKKAKGRNQKELKRNSPGLIHSLYTHKFFWDGRAHKTHQQIEHVVFSDDEFNTSYMDILNRLKTDENLLRAFKTTFPNQSSPLSRHNILEALSAYVASLTDWNTKFDRNARGDENSLTHQEQEGFNLFMGKAQCGICHFAPLFNGTVPPLFTDSETEVLGTPSSSDKSNAHLDEDLGRYANGLPKDEAYFYKHSFKTPSIRNAANTAPYMHNGVFATLEELIDFYNDGGGQGWGFDVPFQTLPSDPLGLTEQEKQSLIAFIRSLSSENR